MIRKLRIYKQKFLVWWDIHKPTRRSYALPIVLVILALRLICGVKEGQIKITYLDVGQGTGIGVAINHDTLIMIDGGSTSESEVGNYIIVPYIKASGYLKVSYWFISHSDEDHVSGLIEILEDYDESIIKIENIVLPAYHMDDEKYDEIIEAAAADGINIKYISSGDSITFYDDYKKPVKLYCLSPYESQSFTDHNEESEVMYLSYGNFQTLMLGDMPVDGDEHVIEEIDKLNLSKQDVEVVVASHHGSKTGTSDDLLDKINAKYSIISAGEDNTYGHPHEELLERLNKHNIKYFETKDTGAVIFTTNGKSMDYETMK